MNPNILPGQKLGSSFCEEDEAFNTPAVDFALTLDFHCPDVGVVSLEDFDYSC